MAGKKYSLTSPSAKLTPAVTPEQFIQKANDTPAEAKTYPWEEPKVRDDVIKMVSLRLSEPYILKLQYLSEKTHKSQQELIREILLPWLDEEVKKY